MQLQLLEVQNLIWRLQNKIKQDIKMEMKCQMDTLYW